MPPTHATTRWILQGMPGQKKKKTQKALHNEKKLLQGIAACEYCCHDNSSGYDFKCRCIRAGVHLLCVHCLLTRMDAQFCFCATKMCVCAVHSQTSRDCDCIFHTAGYPGEQPFCFALLPCREKKMEIHLWSWGGSETNWAKRSITCTLNLTLINKSVGNARETEARKISHHNVASPLLFSRNWVSFDRAVNGYSSLAYTPRLCFNDEMALSSNCDRN